MFNNSPTERQSCALGTGGVTRGQTRGLHSEPGRVRSVFPTAIGRRPLRPNGCHWSERRSLFMAVPLSSRTEPIPGYKLIERLGRGGFGEVWKCEAPGGIHKAIKFVYGDLNASGDGEPAEQ